MDHTLGLVERPHHPVFEALEQRILLSGAGDELSHLSDDAYEDNDSMLIVDARPAGAANSPNLGVV